MPAQKGVHQLAAMVVVVGTVEVGSVWVWGGGGGATAGERVIAPSVARGCQAPAIPQRPMGEY